MLEPFLWDMPYMSRSRQNLWRRKIFSYTFTEFCFLHRSPYFYCSWRQPYKLFPRPFLVFGTRDLISTSYHINTEGWLFRSCCQHTAGIPFSSSVQQAEGLCIEVKVMQNNSLLKPDYLSGLRRELTQQCYSPSLLHPDLLRGVACHEVPHFCFPLSHCGQGVSTFSPQRFSGAVSHKL